MSGSSIRFRSSSSNGRREKDCLIASSSIRSSSNISSSISSITSSLITSSSITLSSNRPSSITLSLNGPSSIRPSSSNGRREKDCLIISSSIISSSIRLSSSNGKREKDCLIRSKRRERESISGRERMRI